MTPSASATLRAEMVDTQVAGRGVRSESVLDALRAVPREAFVPEALREFAGSVHRVEPVALGAAATRKGQGIGNVHILHDTAVMGWPDRAYPFGL